MDSITFTCDVTFARDELRPDTMRELIDTLSALDADSGKPPDIRITQLREWYRQATGIVYLD